LNTAAKKADDVMTWVYLGLNFVGLLLSIAAIRNFDVGFLATNTATTASSSSWNYTVGGIVNAIRQLHQGELRLGLTNLLRGMQLTSCTVVANIAKYTTLIQLSPTVTGCLMGFSFAACMFIGFCIELYEIYKSNKRIHLLEKTLVNETRDDNKQVIQKIILIEKA
jgi:hypothetical protein